MDGLEGKFDSDRCAECKDKGNQYKAGFDAAKK
jgi:hypothetical protein